MRNKVDKANNFKEVNDDGVQPSANILDGHSFENSNLPTAGTTGQPTNLCEKNNLGVNDNEKTLGLSQNPPSGAGHDQCNIDCGENLKTSTGVTEANLSESTQPITMF